MEHLDILEKIYQYGETLSSEEMNQIVSHINIIIDAVNSLIRNNSGISNGHCEMRYILSTSQPTKPATGTNGLSNGWSDLYLLPEAGTGKSTWMSLCFASGENGYGEWSTPICLSSGTSTGQQGPKGNSGEVGAFVSRVFKRQNSKPNRPTGGSYYNPVPDGWHDGIPEGTAIIWSSTCTFYGNGTQTSWSEPAQESDTATLDIEFSPLLTQPPAPLGNKPFSNHESEGWYDPNSSNFSSAGTMIWRAERKVANGEYDGDWTVTRIYGEQGEKGLKGEAGGHYEFRYINFKATQGQAAPIKPADGTDGTSGGWNRTQQSLTEIEIKEGLFTWMTQCYFDNGTYGTWSTPIRITGANGIDGEDGTEQEFIYTRNNTGNIPPTPPRTQKNEAALFNNLGEWVVNGIAWTDDPQGVNDEMMWEYVSTRVKEGTIWSEWSTPVVWAKWGKQGRIGQMSYLAGVWDSQTTYTKTAERNPVVYYDNEYYYLIGEITQRVTSISSTGQNPKTNTSVWAKAENFEMVFTDILFVNEFAKLASFIINEDWMLSRNGTIYDANGGAHDIDNSHSWTSGGKKYDANTAYVEFDPSYPDSNKPGSINFVPAIAIDSLSGRAFFWKGKFTGDVVANSLRLGSSVKIPQSNVNNLVTDLGNITDELGNVRGQIVTVNGVLATKLSSSDVSVSESTTSGGLTKRTITVGNKTFTEIESGDFVLTDIGKTGNGSYFVVSREGLMEAHNAIVYGTIFATAGQFSGEVNATKFIAGDPGGLNITTTGDAISFNYGGERRAWFTTKDPDDNDTSGMYLYLRSPDGGIITIDFTNLTFKNTSITGSAIQQTNIYRDYTDSNCQSSIFINNSDNLYYSNSQLTSLLTGNYYRQFRNISCFVDYNGRYANYSARIYQKVSIAQGVLSVVGDDYYASSEIDGSIRSLYGSAGASGLSSSNTYLGDSDLTIANNPNINIGSGQSFYLAHVGTQGGGKITSVTSQSWSGNQGTDLVADSEYTIHSN